MTPYRQPVAGQVQPRFNKHHAKARGIIECCFGMLKTRWPAFFLRALEIRPLFAPKVILACCILHNLCLLTGDISNILEEDEEEEDEEHQEHQGNVPDQGDQELSAIHLRARLAAQVFAPGELPAFPKRA
ncbi:hypothetical protein FQN60_010507 [Etheostoma spectabile]|uniref:DDE Tnp4 domain-containing protein n=1 Tax=Etheostoma spectabile TaxID=54343 RepID=A0A5J5D369_9PERO|nr:hypothetical protein FQN60_010507 [Etheostoma spectabile]